ncbi:hypothetical protein [Altibacter sp.]|uniref:tetratricopeptide repeat protein n=1 Tax=Altibacter sp. TaxID=2024823 RepID=UPI002584820C|nr:hypothetical protein [Altibacter sp.]MCW9036837.1 hypothetical protein [Altibacter sp.]
MKLNSFLKECSEKEVFKMLSIYIVSSWVLIQVLAVTWQPLALPERSVTVLIIALLLGFPLYIFYIWKSRIAPSETEEDLSEKGLKKYSKFKRMYFSSLAVICILVVVAVSLIANNAFGNRVSLASVAATDKIGILNFGNNTGNAEYEVVSKMTADWITHGITQHQLGQVVSPEIVNDYISIIKASEKNVDNQSVLKNYFKPGKVITGNFFLNGPKLIFQSSIMDGDIDETLISFPPVECDAESPLDCIESLKQLILGYFSTSDAKNLSLQEDPPKYKAYQALLDAKSNFANGERYIKLLNEAIAEDSNYFEPKVLRVGFYYNKGEFQKADSLLQKIVPNSRDNRRQINLLNHYDALLSGNNKKIYATVVNEYNFAPFDMQTNASTLVVAHQYVNRPKDVDTLFSRIDMQKMELSNCTFCQHRYYIRALSQVEQKQYRAVIETMPSILAEVPELYLRRPLVAAYVRSGAFNDLEAFLKKEAITGAEEDVSALYLIAGREALMVGASEKATQYFNKVLEPETTQENSNLQIDALYFSEAYGKLLPLLKKQAIENPDDPEIRVKQAVALYHTGNPSEAEERIRSLEALRTQYQYGNIDYGLAQYFAAVGNREEALKYLLKSVADGNTYTPQTFQNDPHFTAYKDLPEFKRIMTYWH